MVHVYAGQPDRERHRPVIPRGVRKSTLEHSRENKENLRVGAQNLHSEFNGKITDLANTTGFPRSIVAREAYKTGKRYQGAPRSANVRNAWLAARMREVNLGEYFIQMH
jgi:hypothetical protein